MPINSWALSVTSYNIVGDGVDDDSNDFQTAINAAATLGVTLEIPPNFTIRITKNLFIHGTCNIVGGGESSVILCDADLAYDEGRAYWISIGITNTKASGGIQKTFNGTISDLTIKASSNAKFQRALYIFNASNLTIDNVLFDFVSGISEPADILFGPIGSGNNGIWMPSGALVRTNFTITNNTVYASHTDTDQEGISISFSSNVLIANNHVEGVGDDPIAIHSVTNCEIRDNGCFSLDGRIFVSSSTDVRIYNNYSTRIASAANVWSSGGAMIMVCIEGNNSLPPTDIEIKNNFVSLPAELTTYTYGIRICGGRDVVVDSNIVEMNSPNGGGCIRVEADALYTGWSDPTGEDLGNKACPRNVTITNNLCEGIYPGGIEQSGDPETLVGPFFVKGNEAGSYIWYTDVTHLYNSNLIRGGNYAAANVPLISLADPLVLFNESFTVSPGGTTNGVVEFTATRAGRIAGYVAQFTSPITAPTAGWVNMRLFKNGAQISVSTISTASATINLNRLLPVFAFSPGDKFKLVLSGTSSLAPAGNFNVQVSVQGFETDLSAIYSFDGGTVGADNSGNANNGTIVSGTTTAGQKGQALALAGSGEMTAAHSPSLSVTDNLSVSFWINSSALMSGYAGHVVRKSTNTLDSNFDCYFFGTTGGALLGKLGFYANAGGTWKPISGFYTLPFNQWVHVGFVYKSATGGQLYINGAPFGIPTGSGLLATNAAPLKVGTGIQGGVDQLRLYRRALAATEIKSLYDIGH